MSATKTRRPTPHNVERPTDLPTEWFEHEYEPLPPAYVQLAGYRIKPMLQWDDADFWLSAHDRWLRQHPDARPYGWWRNGHPDFDPPVLVRQFLHVLAFEITEGERAGWIGYFCLDDPYGEAFRVRWACWFVPEATRS